ncbi:sensor histidine kinase/response regulator [Aspergillus sclerotiicarbonarius CBS 121057]|uniref:histidine kinase n=1 Tax=Aspergillus sclerotiicarbonarius (strain CBS 121057 / IBT 28362) TaxID=1448318 RepID=A0A319ELQ4_ASPSB|nr:sensor histidine kinase/response regulator [Aspergillus sclerotiicarbonarius CBS 121057]
MGEVRSMRTPPLPSPAEAPSPVAAPHSHRRDSSQSTGFLPVHNAGFSIDGDAITENNTWNANSHSSPIPLEQTSNACHITTPAKKDNPEAGKYPEDQGRSLQTLKELRRQMEELLVYQQMQQSQNQSSSASREAPSSQTDPVSSNSPGSTRKRPLNVSFQKVTSSTGAMPSASFSDSTGSGGTIRAMDSTPENLTGQTPSYPFPRMQTQPTSKPSQNSTLSRSAFKLTLPSEKLKIHMAPSQIEEEQQLTGLDTPHLQRFFLPPQAKNVIEDPNYPSPNLYDLTLQLNADPGLDAWWGNVIHILQAHYGAERVSLAVPGDATDLENVPWGQKAVFDQNIEPESQARHLHDETTTTRDNNSKEKEDLEKKKESFIAEALANGSSASNSPKRPSLLSRHSFAGFGKERKNPNIQDSDTQRLRSLKNPSKPEVKRTSTLPENPTAAETEPLHTHDTPRQAVFPIPRPLEVETDPLIKRTGVVKLFGRTEPVVLTREYSQGLASDQTPCETPEDKIQVTPSAEPSNNQAPYAARARSTSNPPALGLQAHRSMEFFDEYEQIPPSPWSQSPAPSPAPRAHAEQNPFFVSHAVDEEAFAKHPPPHDYSNLKPLEAIGVDLAKSVVHIPLLHAGRSKQTSPSTLRFPVAVISILSSIMPYPSNLRKSLAYLMPHLTTSFCLAQQYSQLERQVTSRLEIPRYGHLLGLGGTFSDESSELELVAGLSGHVNYTIADDGSLSARASLSSPEERAGSTKPSPSISGLGTPGFDLSNIGAGTNTNPNESPGLAARLGNDGVDSYFNVQQSKQFREAIAQHRIRLSKAKQSVPTSTPTSPGKLLGKVPTEEELAPQDQSPAIISPSQEIKAPPVISPTQTSSRHPSTNSFYAQLQRELPRPFTDTVAQLMLNSVPLHLFLAKPQSGEVIWTNSKFDAFRRSQPQEQKLRDPWQNIHSSEREHVSQEWANALRTGSQFTERVRVKRFNDESAYRWFIFRANPLLSATGEVLYWIGSFLDIHEQHIAELKAAQEREKFATDAKYRAFSNSIPQIVFEATEYRGLIFVNEQWHLYTGQKLEDALNFGFAKHVHHDDLEKCGLLSVYLHEAQKNGASLDSGEVGTETTTAKASQEKHLGQGVTPALEELVKRGVASVQRDENGRVFYSTELRLRSKGGDFRWHLVRLVCVETSSFGSGEASWYGTCTDINDRKNLERELNKAMQQLNNQMESKTKFFSNMSHEIRTPLNGILGTIPFILDTQLDTDQRRMLDTIQNSSTNLRELVDNILDVSRVEAGKMSLVNSWFHVRSVIEDVIDTVSSRAIDKGLEINYLMDVDVPPMVIGDRFRIRQVLINLVGNAVKFTAQGEIHICCSIYHDSSANMKKSELLLNFDVVDTGKGFSARDAERLMQRFSQLGQNGSQQHAGSGLGLFLSKQLVEMHGGKLTPSSKEGQGAKFSFHVKVDAPPPPTHDESRTIRQSQGASEALGAQPKLSSLQKLLFSKDPLNNKGPDQSELSSALESSLTKAHPNADPSSRFPTNNLSERSSFSSALPTPDLSTVDPLVKIDSSAPGEGDTVTPVGGDSPRPATESSSQAQETPDPTKPTALDGATDAKQSPSSFSILILCPMDNTRKAIKQHIEQVVPLEVPFSITSTPDVEDWRDHVSDESVSKLTHLVLNLPSVDDVSDVIQYVSECDPATAPTLVIISDLYQKRQVNSKIKELAATGKRVYTVPKPVKPSAFSAIFDPDNRRDLSKDRNQDMAREINNNFKTMSKMVKEVIGNKGYRILLVEDDETNRMVMLKYLDKIKVMAETATNGQECTEMVFSKEPGYYSLIICDIQMPVKNGYDTCREIRQWELKNHYPQIPIMALSANAMTDQIEDAARAGFNDYVTKPIKHNELGKMMMGLLDPNRPLLLLRDRLRADSEDHHRE